MDWLDASVHYSEKMSFSTYLLNISLRRAQVFCQNATFAGLKRYQPLLKHTQSCPVRVHNGVTPHLFLFNQPLTTVSAHIWKHSNFPLSQNSSLRVQVRTVTKYSKLGKRKTVKSVAKRFMRTGTGKLKYWPAGKVHNMLAKSRKKRLQLRKARYATKTQLKTLNKMISGW